MWVVNNFVLRTILHKNYQENRKLVLSLVSWDAAYVVDQPVTDDKMKVMDDHNKADRLENLMNTSHPPPRVATGMIPKRTIREVTTFAQALWRAFLERSNAGSGPTSSSRDLVEKGFALEVRVCTCCCNDFESILQPHESTGRLYTLLHR